MAKAKDDRERVKLTFSKAEMRRVKPALERLNRWDPVATSAKKVLLLVVENIDAFEALVTRGAQKAPEDPAGSHEAPQVPCLSPARAHGSSSQKEDQKREEKNKSKKGNSRLAPLDVSERIIGYLNEQAGSSFQFKAAGHRKHLQSVLNRGATEEQILEVIRKKCAQWRNSENMAHCMRPSTLFGSKFEEYLGEAEAKGNSSGGRKGLAARLAEKQGGFFNGKW